MKEKSSRKHELLRSRFRKSKLDNKSASASKFLAGTLTCWQLCLLISPAQAQTLDLSSVDRNVSATQSGQITVGDNTQSVSVGDMLTPAEHFALQQSIGGAQTLVISEHGNAIGGTINIGANLSTLNSLVIPTGVTAVQTAASLNIAGNFTNNGTLYSVPEAATAIVNAMNIYNNPGALISTMPPSITGLATNMPVNLTLIATNNIINAGQIISAANLSLTAGGNIINALPSGVSAAAPIMQAMNSINLVSGTGQITNSGILNAIAGNINISSIAPANILVNNIGGQILAQLGALNLREQLFNTKFDTVINGGSILSDQVNVWGASGNASIDVTDLTGQLNISAGTAHVLAATDNLRIGTMQLIGDPTYFNSVGSISINSAISTNGNALAIIANGNITSAAGSSISTTTTSSPGAGGALLIMAGAQFTTNGGTGASTSSAQGTGDVGTTLTITGGSSTGGLIDLSKLAMLSTAGASGAGGNITLVAFAGSGANSGTINTSGISYSQTATAAAPYSVTAINNPGAGTATLDGAFQTAGNALPMTAGTTVITMPATTGFAQNQTVFLTNGSVQEFTTITAPPAAGSITTNATVQTYSGTAPNVSLVWQNFAVGQTVEIATGATSETQVIQSLATPGNSAPFLIVGTLANSYTAPTISGTTFTVPASAGFSIGQRVTITQGANTVESVVTGVTATTVTTGYVSPVLFTAPTITASGIHTSGGGGPNGNVTMIAGATSGMAINTGDIYTAGSQPATGGQITLLTGSPAINNAAPITVLNGIVTAGDIVSASVGATNNASITTGNFTTNSAPISIVSGSNTSLGGTLKTNGTPAVGAVGPGGQISIFSAGNITSAVASSGLDSSGTVLNASGGNILLLAGVASTANFQQTFGLTDILTLTVDSGAASASGGQIDLSGAGSFNITTFSSKGSQVAGPGTYGGNVDLVAMAGTGASSGMITLPAALTLNTGGLSNGNSPGGFANQNGNVTVLAGAASGTSITLGNINTVGSNAGAGNITLATTQASLTNNSVAFSYAIASNSTTITTNGSISIPLSGTGQAVLQPASIIVGNLAAAGGSVPIPPTGNTQSTLTTAISVQAGQNLGIGNVSNTNNSLPAGIFTGGAGCSGCIGLSASSINLSSGGTLTFNGSPTVASNATASNPVYNLGIDGGTITISGQSLSGMATITANGTTGYIATEGTGGNGGTIAITSSSASSDINVGAAGLSISAIGDNAGGNGGNISINSGRDISITPASFTANPQAGSNVQFTPPNFLNAFVSSGRGATINLTSGRNLFIGGNFGADGAWSTYNAGSGNPGGNGGIVNITVNSSNPFQIGATAAVVNGIQGNLTANGNLFQAGAEAALGNGGSISVTNLGSGGITVAANASAPPPLSLQVIGADASTNFWAGSAGSISLTGATVLVSANLDASGGAASANFGSGNGGIISITTTSTTPTPFVVGTPTNNGVTGSITANGLVGGTTPPAGPAAVPVAPYGNGGTVIVTNQSGGITIDNTGNISVTAAGATSTSAGGSGGTIILNAPQGPVLSQQALAANGGAASSATDNDAGIGGVVSITSNDPANPFVVGAAPGTSGVTGSIQANGYSGGSVTINSNGPGGIQIGAGALTVTASANLNNTQAGGNGGNISLSAANGPLQVTGDLDVSGSTGPAPGAGFNFGGNGGTINILVNSSANPFTIGSAPGGSNNYVSGALKANGGFGIAGAGFGGHITVTNSASDINIGANGIQVIGPAATLSGYAGDGGSITLAATQGTITSAALNADGGGGYLPPPGTIHYAKGYAGSITLTMNSSSAFAIGSAGTGSVTSLSASGWNGGQVSVTNNGSGGITVADGSINIKAEAADPAVSPIDVLQYGQRNLSGPGGTITLSAPSGPIVLNGSLDASGGPIFEQLATNALPITSGTTTINVGSTAGFAIGQEVVISDGTNSERQIITNVGAGSISVAGLANSYTTAPTVSAYLLEQVATAPLTSYTDVTDSNPAIAAGSNTINVTDGNGLQNGQQIFLYNPSFTQDITNTLPVNAGTTVLNVADTSGFAATQTVLIQGAGGPPAGESNTISSVTPGVSITLNSGLTNTYTGIPTVTANSVSQVMTVSTTTATSITFTGNVTEVYQQPVTAVAADAVIPLPQSQGFMVNQAVSISSGSLIEQQFISAVNSPNPNTISTGQLINNFPTPPTVRAGSPGGSVNIAAGTTITQTAGTIHANSIILNGASGIGTSTAPIQVNAITNLLPGTLSVTSNGPAYVNNTSSSISISSVQAAGFSLSSNGNIAVDGPINSTGTLSLINTNTTLGSININNGPFDTANTVTAAGALLIQNNNLAGLINIANMVTINSNGMTLTSGPAPLSPVAGSLPANVIVNPAGSPSVFFGAGLNATGPVTINAGTGAGNIIFNGANAGTINFSGGLVLNSVAPAPPLLPSAPPLPPILSSPPPLFILGASILGLGTSRPFGTIVASDQTPESNPEQQIESEQNNAQTLFSSAGNALKGQLFFTDRSISTITSTDDIVNLPHQNGLVFASKDTRIQTGMADLSVKKGSAVLILQTSSELAIYNLHDESRGAVHATVDGKTFAVPVGRQVTVTKQQTPHFDKINPSSIAYRQLSSTKHGDKHVFFSEFSPLSALTSVVEMLSPEDKYHQQIAKRMLKTAAAIYVLGQQAGKPAFKSNH